ncbi:MAG: metallophosphoesterase [Acidobacteria bacterium]|nr:metallophosphoesterase [Acidobacteriota bacterium]MBI3656528.1 metallophosphoesterase [Acidobacteriota bacterium]
MVSMKSYLPRWFSIFYGSAITLLILCTLTGLYADDAIVRFAVIGDMGIGCDAKDGNQCKIADLMCEYQDQFDFVITVGDNIYPDGDPKLFPPNFEEPYRCLLELGMPFYASLGNHDTESSRWRYEEANVNYPNYHMIDDRDEVHRRFYSFRKGSVTRNSQTVPLIEFLALDSNRVAYPDRAPEETDQLPWLTQRFQVSDAVWKIPYFHHPLYVSNSDGTDRIMRETFEQIFIDNGVRLVFTGHKHQFEEIRPQSGIRYIISGAAGRLNRGGVRRGSPLVERYNDSNPHFLIVEATESALTWVMIDGNGEPICFADGDDDTPLDCRGRVSVQ